MPDAAGGNVAMAEHLLVEKSDELAASSRVPNTIRTSTPAQNNGSLSPSKSGQWRRQPSMPLKANRLKTVIQTLFEIQSAVHGYLGPETQQELVRKIKLLTTHLTHLTTTTSSLPVQIPPEIVAYVEDGRNPDIYTREFVELVQKGNQYLKGKAEAFASFRDVLAREMEGAMPEVSGEVRRVVQATGRGRGMEMTGGRIGTESGLVEGRNGERGALG